jgi:hypothetical protein
MPLEPPLAIEPPAPDEPAAPLAPPVPSISVLDFESLHAVAWSAKSVPTAQAATAKLPSLSRRSCLDIGRSRIANEFRRQRRDRREIALG